MAELLLSCQDLGKSFGSAPLFEGLSFGVFEGDHIGLVGPNGSGKTTLLKILAGLEEPSTGTRAARKRLRFGFVAQDPKFDPDHTVEQVLRASIKDSHLDPHEVDTKVAIMMGTSGFDDPDAKTAILSGGWKKRLAIAVELIREPELMPTAIEEFLRAYSPVTMAREVMKETVIEGCPVKPNNMVLLSFPAANRDPAMFPDADKVIIDRKENRHAAFGLGIHRCVGSNLARLEMIVAIEEWLKRIPDFRLDPAGRVAWSQGTVRGPRKMPILFGKAK